MHDRAVRPGARDRREAQIAEIFALAAEGFEPVAGGDLGKAALRRLARQPGEEAGQRRAVAAMRGAGAVELDRVLARLRQQARVGGAVDPGAGLRRAGRRSTRRRSPGRPGPARPRRRARRAPARASRACAIATPLPRWRSRPGASLRRSMNRVTAAVVAQDRERQRQRRVRHVAAADVQQPGDQFGHRQHRRRDALLGQAAGEPGALRLRALAGKSLGMRHHRRQRRRPAARARPGRAGCRRPARKLAPAFSAAARNRSTSCGVCSHGS